MTIWYTFVECLGGVKTVIKFVFDSNQRFAKDGVEGACDAGQFIARVSRPNF